MLVQTRLGGPRVVLPPRSGLMGRWGSRLGDSKEQRTQVALKVDSPRHGTAGTLEGKARVGVTHNWEVGEQCDRYGQSSSDLRSIQPRPKVCRASDI